MYAIRKVEREAYMTSEVEGIIIIIIILKQGLVDHHKYFFRLSHITFQDCLKKVKIVTKFTNLNAFLK